MSVDERTQQRDRHMEPDLTRRWHFWRHPWLRAFWNRAYKENITGLSGMVAYNLMLAVFPFALLVLFIFGQVVNSSDIELSVVRDIQRLFPNIEQETLQHAIDRVRASSTTIGIAAAVGGIWIGASFWGAMDTAFCRIYHVECRGWVQQKRWSLVMLLALLLLLAASVTVPTVESAVADECQQPAVRPRPVGCSPDSDRRDRRPDRHLPDHLGDLLGRPQGPHALALRVAGGALLRAGHLGRQLHLPPLPHERFGPPPDRRDDRVHPDRPGLVLRDQPGAARGRGDQLAAPESTTRALPMDGLPRGERPSPRVATCLRRCAAI